jgi:hypothetical protein
MKITVTETKGREESWRKKIYCEGKGVTDTKRIMLVKTRRNKRRSDGERGNQRGGRTREGRDKGRIEGE